VEFLSFSERIFARKGNGIAGIQACKFMILSEERGVLKIRQIGQSDGV